MSVFKYQYIDNLDWIEFLLIAISLNAILNWLVVTEDRKPGEKQATPSDW